MSAITRINLIAILVGFMSVFTASAQQQLNDLIDQMTKNSNCEVIYSEMRNPETHKVTSSSYVINSSDMELYDKVYKTIQEERPNSVSYSQVGKEVISISFLENNKSVSYSLIMDNKKGSWMLSKSDSFKKSQKQRPGDVSVATDIPLSGDGNKDA